MRLFFTATIAAALGSFVLSNASGMSIQNPSEGMKLQSADPPGQTVAPKPKKKPASEGKTKAPEKKSDSLFIDSYQQAYNLIYQKRDYAGGIALLRTLGRDDHPDVANLIGFSSRKLGRTEDAKLWYEKALASDPSHTRTWQYYGLWHLERGDRAKAEEHLEKIRLICGQGCEDYTSLRDALDDRSTY